MSDYEITKQCRRCVQDLPLTRFYKNPDHKDGYNSICKSCAYNTERRIYNDPSCELSLPELKALLKEHKITGKTHLNKPEIIELLKEHGVLPPNYIAGIRRVKNVASRTRSTNPKHEVLSKIRNSRRRVELTVIDPTTLKPTDEVYKFPSLYKTAKYLSTFSYTISNFNGCDFKSNDKIYRINILDPKN
jgi:hypothetical protein